MDLNKENLEKLVKQFPALVKWFKMVSNVSPHKLTPAHLNLHPLYHQHGPFQGTVPLPTLHDTHIYFVDAQGDDFGVHVGETMVPTLESKILSFIFGAEKKYRLEQFEETVSSCVKRFKDTKLLQKAKYILVLDPARRMLDVYYLPDGCESVEQFAENPAKWSSSPMAQQALRACR